METTPRHDLPLIMPSQAQKHVTHNEAVMAIDARLHAHALSRHLAAPPAAPQEGDAYLVAEPGEGEWAGLAGSLAVWTGSSWLLAQPVSGFLVYVVAENILLVFDGDAWRTQGNSQDFDRIAINTSGDEHNRLSVKAHSTLLDAETADGGHQLKVNRHGSDATASLLFQTSYEGRAEIGLAGNENLSVKTSNDGTNWRTALTFDGATGYTGVGSGNTPGCALDVSGNLARVSSPGFAAFGVAATGPGGREYRFAATDDTNGLGGGRFVLFDQSAGAMRLGVSANAFETMLPLRLMTASASAMPDPAAAGGGALVYVADAPGGARVAFSDGTVWRWVNNGTAV